MTPRSFEQTHALSLAELHALRASAEPRVRLWATWALAMRDDASTRARLEDVRGEVDAGVRRHLVVVLAGRQDTAALETIAALDPDDEVRATALQYLIRLTRLLAIDTPGLDWSWVLACVTRAQDPIHDAYGDVAFASWRATDLAVEAVLAQPDHDGGTPLRAIIELALAGHSSSLDDDESPETLEVLENQRRHLRAFLARSSDRGVEISRR